MEKASILPFIYDDTVCRVLRNTGLLFSEEINSDQKRLEIEN